MAERKYRFSPHEGVNEVEIAVTDGLVTVTSEKEYETTDPIEIRALDEHPLIKRLPASGSDERAAKKDVK